MKALLATQDVLLIDPRSFAAQVASLEGYNPDARGFQNEGGEDCDRYGDALPKMTVDADGIATIPIVGTIQTGMPSVASAFGFVDTARIREDIEGAVTNPNVRGILLDFDSPGGFVGGTPELGSFIAEVASVKPVYSFTAGLCCSAAYWLAAPSRAIFATPSAELGSIGVYVAHQDQSALAAAMGIVVKVFSSGKYKGAGVPGTSLSDDQAANIKARVDSLAGVFKSHVETYRPGVTQETMQGQTFMGYEAGGVLLCDEVVQTIRDAKKIIASHLTDKSA